MSARPPVFTWNEELHFGPPSEPIHIQSFLDDAEKLHLRGLSPWFDAGSQGTSADSTHDAITCWKEWQELPKEARDAVETDCNLDDSESSLLEVLTLQKQISYLQKSHAAAVGELAVSQASGRKNLKGKAKKPVDEAELELAVSQASGRRSSKGKAKKPLDETELEPLKQAIEKTSLKIWKLKPAAKPYIRAGHVFDQNALVTLQLNRNPSTGATSILSHEVLITLTAYTRNSWYPFAFSRNSQYALSSVNTLADVWDCIPCILKGDGNMPAEVIETDPPEDDGFEHYGAPRRTRVVGYELGNSESDLDSLVMVIEETAYCDGRGSPDYADKLFTHLRAMKAPPPDPDAPPPLPLGPYERPKRSKSLQKGPPIHEVQLRSLTLRINEPYWTLHRGNCEHWFVIDEIRLQNPRDPSSGYPIALQRTPTFRPLCRICSKVPATLSILNDVRLCESPAMVCKPCWELFGGPPQPKEDDDPDAQVVVVPMIIEMS